MNKTPAAAAEDLAKNLLERAHAQGQLTALSRMFTGVNRSNLSGAEQAQLNEAHRLVDEVLVAVEVRNLTHAKAVVKAENAAYTRVCYAVGRHAPHYWRIVPGEPMQSVSADKYLFAPEQVCPAHSSR